MVIGCMGLSCDIERKWDCRTQIRDSITRRKGFNPFRGSPDDGNEGMNHLMK